jgi:hypothetical protein
VNLTRTISLLSIGFLLSPAFLMSESSGSICVAPVPHSIDGRRGAGPESVVCDEGRYSLKIDARKPIPWPETGSLKIDDVNVAGRHRITVLCDGKPKQSFIFSFSGYKGHKLCLFFNDLYWTVQLWDDEKTPWCKCK